MALIKHRTFYDDPDSLFGSPRRRNRREDGGQRSEGTKVMRPEGE
jgi:hypothetical protein